MTYLGILLAVFAETRYIHSILTGRSKPNFSAWAIFTTSMILVLASSWALGARDTLAIVAVFTFLHLITTILAFRYRTFTLTKFEITLLCFVGISVILWIITENAWTALLINILIDSLGFLALAQKLYQHPGTEDRIAWAVSLIAYIINISTLEHWVPEEYLFTISNIFWISLITILTLRKQKTDERTSVW